MAVVLGAAEAQAQQVVRTFDEQHFANTPMASNALSIQAHIELQQTCDGYALAVNVTTRNMAATDGGTGCVRVAVMQNGEVASSFLTCSPPNRPRGFIGRPTYQTATGYFQVPPGLQLDGLAFRLFNADHEGESVDWQRIIALVLRFV